MPRAAAIIESPDIRNVTTTSESRGDKMAPRPISIFERLDRNSIPVTECGCQIWTGGLTQDGYGEIKINGKKERAHRVSWRENKGKIPPRMCILHRCDTRPCINPDHLFIGTRPDNVEDMDKKGRRKVGLGENHGHSKLTKEDIIAIRTMPGTAREIAQKFGVAHSGIVRIKQGHIWKSVARR